MAIAYKGPKAVLSGMREDVVKPQDYWRDFQNKILAENAYWTEAFTKEFNKQFSGLTKGWDKDKYLAFF